MAQIFENHPTWSGIVSKGLTAIGENRLRWTNEYPTLLSRQRLRNWIPDPRDNWAILIVTRKTTLQDRRFPWWARVLKLQQDQSIQVCSENTSKGCIWGPELAGMCWAKCAMQGVDGKHESDRELQTSLSTMKQTWESTLLLCPMLGFLEVLVRASRSNLSF